MQLHCRKKCTIYSILGVYMHFLGRGGAYINELAASLDDYHIKKIKLMRIAFWNINNKFLIDEITELTVNENLDLLILAECKYSDSDIINRLSTSTSSTWNICTKSKRIKIFARLDSKYIDNFDGEFDGPSWTVTRLRAPLQSDIAIVGVHMPSKLYLDNLSQSFECVNIMSKVRKFENEKTTKKTLLIGDFNMNPFEPGMTASIGIHGIKDRTIAINQLRKIQKIKYDYFYNPMWNFLGDASSPTGTFYYPQSVHITHFWHTFDQLLFRPHLLRYYDDTSLKIITKIGRKNLLNAKGIPLKTYSDHLPIFVSFNLIK